MVADALCTCRHSIRSTPRGTFVSSLVRSRVRMRTMATTLEVERVSSIVHNKWRYWLERVSTKQLAKGEEYRLLRFLVDSDHDFREDEIFAPREARERHTSATLTP